MHNSLKEKTHRALRWSERYIKTDMVYLAKGGFWLTFGHGMQMLGGLVLTIALANLLPKESYGVYQFIISVSAVIAGFTLSGMGIALTRAVARKASGTLAYAFKTQLQWSVGAVILSVAVASYYYINDNYTLATAFLITGFLSPLFSGFSLYRPYLEGKQLFRESTVLGIWRRPIPIVSVITALFFTKDPVILVFVFFISQVFSAGLLYLLVTRKHPEPTESHPEMLHYSKHLSLMGLVGLIANHIDKILVFHFLGAAPVAIYTLATLPYMQLKNMFGLISSLMFPKLAQRDFKTLKESLPHKLFLYFIASIFVVFGYIIAAPYIFNIFFPQYTEAIVLSQVLILTLLAKPFSLYNQVFIAHGAKGPQYFIKISSALVKLGLLLLLLPIYGMWGAVYALLGMSLYWSIVVVSIFYARKELN